MIGRTLSHFRITAKLGEGGMGEVYRATDTRLEREVAIKLLPEALEKDPERLARFEREAKVLAALDHPNIAAIYGLEEAEGRHVLVMQLAEGETLKERIERGVVPPAEAIPIAVLIAQAIEAAHDKGIIHRDLKPANVKLTAENQVKVLDFGLAKALDLEARSGKSASSLSMSPTLTAQMTGAGVILGTAAYMSPEQARGQEADERSDIWSFGVVLYEMLTGRQTFRGDTVSDTLASVLKEEPDFGALPADTPPAVRRVLARCLEKNSRERLHSIADARIDLQSSDGPVVGRPSDELIAARRPVGWVSLLTVALAGALLSIGLLRLWPGSSLSEDSPRQLHLTINPPTQLLRAFDAAISRQGDFVVFQGYDRSTSKLFLRRLETFEIEVLAHTEGAGLPAISPDGRWVAFVADGKLKKMAVAGGDPLILCDLVEDSPGFRWATDDSIFFTPKWVDSGLYRVSTDGGDPEPLTEPDRSAGELGHWFPHLLPGGKNVLFTIWRAATGLNDADIAVLDLDTGETRVLFDGSNAQFLASGHLLYYHAGNYLVAPFDLESLATTGPSVAVLPDAARTSPNGSNWTLTSVSDDGTLVYLPKHPDDQISWFDRQGTQTRWSFGRGDIGGIDSAPDGRLAVTIAEGGAFQIRILDPEGGTEERFAFGDGSFWAPSWRPDGKAIAFTSLHQGSFDVVVKTYGETEMQAVVTTKLDESAEGWSSDGSQVIFDQYDDQGKVHLWAINPNDGSEPIALTSGQATERNGSVSSDNRWLAYDSDRTGRSEVFVQAFPEADQVVKISSSGGTHPRWAKDGQRLYYKRGREILEVRFRDESGRFVVESDTPVLELPPFSGSWDVAPDGRFVVVTATAEERPRFEVVTNWFEELERMAPTEGK